MKESMSILCYTSNYDKVMYSEFEYVYYAVSYVNPKEKLAKTE